MTPESRWLAAAEQRRNLSSGEGIGASLDAVAQDVAHQLFEGKRSRVPDWRRDRESHWWAVAVIRDEREESTRIIITGVIPEQGQLLP